MLENSKEARNSAEKTTNIEPQTLQYTNASNNTSVLDKPQATNMIVQAERNSMKQIIGVTRNINLMTDLQEMGKRNRAKADEPQIGDDKVA